MTRMPALRWLSLALLASAAFGQDIRVVVFISTICPMSNSYNLRMKNLYRDYAPKGVKFEFLNANQNETPAEGEDHARRGGVATPAGSTSRVAWRESDNTRCGRRSMQC